MGALDSGQPEQAFTFEEILSRLEAERRADAVIDRTADYMLAASLLDEDKNILQEALHQLMREDPRNLFLEFLKDCVHTLKSVSDVHKYRFARQINDVAIMGLGIWQEDLRLAPSGSDFLKLTGEPDWSVIADHIERTVFGPYFIQEISVPPDTELWGEEFPFRISACDASQHRIKLRVPFNKTWATPAIINNSGATIKERIHNAAKSDWKNIAVPRDTREYEDWVILGPDDYAEMEENDYEWAAKSAMDVGEFFVEDTFTLKPDVHFRDGRVFPQDHLMNCRLQNRHGQLTREAIFRMARTCQNAHDLNILYCGVAKQVELKVYSTIVNWYIMRQMGKKDWNPTKKILTDSELMRNLIPHSEFNASTFEKLYVTCLIWRKFETASNLNRRTRNQVQRDIKSLSAIHHNRNLTAHDIAIEALKVNVVMFFAGHSKTDELYIPRYEFVMFGEPDLAKLQDTTNRILSGLRLASFDVDEDHLWGLEDPISTLVPMPILVAHNISKTSGEELASNFAQRATAEFIKRLKAKKSTL